MAANKLSPDARRKVIERIIAGDANSEIRRVLADAGHIPAADEKCLADASISHYRSSETVKEAIFRKDGEAVQSGYAQRSERILKLARSARRFERQLTQEADAQDFADGLAPFALTLLHREYRETLRDIGALVEPKKTAAITVTTSLEIIETASATADAKFATVVARSRPVGVLVETDPA